MLQLAGNMMNSASRMIDVYRESVAIREKTKQFQAYSQVKMAQIVSKYRLAETALYGIFSERGQALSRHYTLLDKAVESDDRQMIISALQGISSIVTSSPLKDFEKLISIYDKTDEPLLDF